MDKINALLNSVLQPYFPLEKYGYILKRALNNENRWRTKIVCSILDRNSKRYVSTTYAKQDDYLRLLETTTYLKCNNKLSPKILKLYPKDKAIVCEYIGEFLSDYLLSNPFNITSSITSIFDYLKDINSINQTHKTFVIPSIVKSSLQLSEALSNDFEFLHKVKVILPKLEESDIKFSYGYGIEDPHIWNFRIINAANKIQALTTDFDFFSERVNCFWELGYLYATFRWFKRISLPLAYKAEEALLSLVQNQNLKLEFMFWLGALSSYCGYKDSLRNFMMNGGIVKLQGQYQLIQQLDKKIFSLVIKLLTKDGFHEKEKIHSREEI